jgi:hypothetical protein
MWYKRINFGILIYLDWNAKKITHEKFSIFSFDLIWRLEISSQSLRIGLLIKKTERIHFYCKKSLVRLRFEVLLGNEGDRISVRMIHQSLPLFKRKTIIKTHPLETPLIVSRIFDFIAIFTYFSGYISNSFNSSHCKKNINPNPPETPPLFY